MYKVCEDTFYALYPLGKAWLGAAKGHASAVMITVGTGIGGGIINDGKIVNGSTYTAGEVGYLPIEDEQDWQSPNLWLDLWEKLGLYKSFELFLFAFLWWYES